MRVIAGTHGGRRLVAPDGTDTRPTSDRVREALFSILGAERLRDARVLDLFAGSGALGIEALSRGASEARFVDSDERAIRAIRANLEALGLTGEVVRSDWRTALHGPRQYDLVLLDPPYRLAERIAPGLSEAVRGLLHPGGTLVTESDRRAPLDLDMPLRDERRYGDTLIRFHGA